MFGLVITPMNFSWAALTTVNCMAKQLPGFKISITKALGSIITVPLNCVSMPLHITLKDISAVMPFCIISFRCPYLHIFGIDFLFLCLDALADFYPQRVS